MKTYISFLSLAFLLLSVSRNDCNASDLVFGPYEVGFSTYKTYDDSRFYIRGEDTISRPLLIHFWYPAQGKSIGHTLDFKHYIDLIALREDFGKSTSDIDNNSFYYVKAYSDFAKSNFGLDTSTSAQMILDSPVYAKNGIPPLQTGSELPLLIYAPSNSKASVQNHMLCEYLASHGFMILSVASAGPNSIQREKIEESTMAQVTDMEYILSYCEDSLGINYASLGLFGYSSGGNAITIFQMRNEQVGAVLSLDGGQEYGAYMGLYNIPDFNLNKANVPYCSIVNNYENFSIYPLYNSILSTEKYIYRMPHLDHNGFISYWLYFDSCSPDSMKSSFSLSTEYLSECALGFFSKYLKSESLLDESKYTRTPDSTYIQRVELNQGSIAAICNALLNNDLSVASRLVDDQNNELFEGANQLNILARMLNNKDLVIWLYQKSVEYHPESWENHYNLGYIYKEKGETLLAKNALLTALELNPDNTDITDLLNEVNKME